MATLFLGPKLNSVLIDFIRLVKTNLTGKHAAIQLFFYSLHYKIFLQILMLNLYRIS